jgi:hypothetical protein
MKLTGMLRYLYILTLLPMTLAARGQTPSPERFVNAIFPTVVDTSVPHYFLVMGTDTCRFVKYD